MKDLDGRTDGRIEELGLCLGCIEGCTVGSVDGSKVGCVWEFVGYDDGILEGNAVGF